MGCRNALNDANRARSGAGSRGRADANAVSFVTGSAERALARSQHALDPLANPSKAPDLKERLIEATRGDGRLSRTSIRTVDTDTEGAALLVR